MRQAGAPGDGSRPLARWRSPSPVRPTHEPKRRLGRQEAGAVGVTGRCSCANLGSRLRLVLRLGTTERPTKLPGAGQRHRRAPLTHPGASADGSRAALSLPPRKPYRHRSADSVQPPVVRRAVEARTSADRHRHPKPAARDPLARSAPAQAVPTAPTRSGPSLLGPGSWRSSARTPKRSGGTPGCKSAWAAPGRPC